jgi:hypothetical protein
MGAVEQQPIDHLAASNGAIPHDLGVVAAGDALQ